MDGFSPEEIVTLMYQIFLGRNPDSVGYAHYVDSLRMGKLPLENVLRSFLVGPEAQKRALAKLGFVASDDPTNKRFPLDYIPPPTEAGKSYYSHCVDGFFRRYMSGDVVLDVGHKGYNNPKGVTVIPSAIGVDLDYPGYDGKRLPFADESADTVYSSHCLEHIDDYQDVLRDWHRVLRIGGFLVCVVPSQFLYERKRRLPSRFNADHKRFYTPASLLSEVQASLEENSYRVRHLEDNDLDYDYNRDLDLHPEGCFEIVLVLEKIRKPRWTLEEA